MRAYRHEDNCTLSPAAKDAEDERVQFVIRTHFLAKQVRILHGVKMLDKVYSESPEDKQV
jgi:hypothetical protein